MKAKLRCQLQDATDDASKDAGDQISVRTHAAEQRAILAAATVFNILTALLNQNQN